MKPPPPSSSTPLRDQDSGEEGFLLDDDATDILEGSSLLTALGSGERRENQQPKVDADFFNAFEDDLDESDMSPPPPSA